MCHALVIEDEPLIADYVAMLAEEAGATSIEFADCEADAVSMAHARRPDIILSDVQLRIGTGPLAVVAILKEWGPVPVIFITGTPDDCLPCDPPAVILGKPIQSEKVIAQFKRLAPRC